MKKIGIITFLRTNNNFGAELQGFALQKKIERMGYQSEIIDYLFFKHPDHKATKASKPTIKLSSKNKIKEYFLYRVVKPLMEKVLTMVHAPSRRKLEKFKKFHKLNTRLSTTFLSFEELYAADMSYDVYIAGSDQIWNPHTGTSLEPYFLTFAPTDKKKISYASSFGVNKIDEAHFETYKNLLNNLDFLSVREAQGVEIIRQITGRDATHVLDPSLLLTQEEWMKFASNSSIQEQEYILLYQLSESPAILSLANKISKERGWPIIRVCTRAIGVESNENVKNVLEAGPSEFLTLFNNASFVLTNSFHGTTFSVTFNKLFYSIISCEKTNNSRLKSFLNLLELSDRLIMEGIDTAKVNIDENSINYKEVNKKIDKERAKSLSFLQTALSE